MSTTMKFSAGFRTIWSLKTISISKDMYCGLRLSNVIPTKAGIRTWHGGTPEFLVPGFRRGTMHA